MERSALPQAAHTPEREQVGRRVLGEEGGRRERKVKEVMPISGTKDDGRRAYTGCCDAKRCCPIGRNLNFQASVAQLLRGRPGVREAQRVSRL